ncbi:cobalamin B12-binding domain-containing protein [Methyloterricola oryzae]|uniref:cobalamin B12-binding domain-containing protein n=1 Tax=Methyloterricola oryzae TaxID=1495050 RepID=UPI00069B93E7|nr:cobalamin-dependent protein [Methyloterricola oryzae]
MDDLLGPFRQSLESLDRLAAESLFEQAVERSSPLGAVESLVVPALEQIGGEWQSGSIALSQIYLSGRLCEELVERVLPASDPDRKHQPRSAIVVLSDFHMLGKRIVYALMRASGFELLDYGRMEVDELVARCLRDRIRVLLISVLMLPSALKVREVCAGLQASGGEVKVIVGGAPFLFDPQLWREVGADAMGRNAADAVTIVRQWMDNMP